MQVGMHKPGQPGRQGGITGLSAGFYKDFYENSPLMFLSVDPQSATVLECNRTVARVTGYSKDEIIGKSVLRLYHPDCREKAASVLSSFMEQKEVHDVHLKLKKKNGQTMDISLDISAVMDDQGNIVRSRSILRDITEWNKSREQVALLAEFPEQNPNPVLRIGDDGTVLYSNRAGEAVLDLWECERGQKLRGQWFEHLQTAFGSGKPLQIETGLCGRIYSLTLAPVVESGFVNIYGLDITGAKQAEQQARHAQARFIEQQRLEKEVVEAELARVGEELVRTTRLAAIGQVSASIAHDLRNPLGSVRNAAYYLKRRLKDTEPKVSQYLGIIEDEVCRADLIISNLMEIARDKKPVKQDVDFGRLCRQYAQTAPEKDGVHMELLLDPEPFMVYGDPTQLRQVLHNLWVNAAEAMQGRGVFSVRARYEAEHAVIVLSDTGCGFAEEVRETLFEPLVTTRTTGTGLGLTICKQIVGAHGGTIHAEHATRGAAFCVRLPLGNRDESGLSERTNHGKRSECESGRENTGRR